MTVIVRPSADPVGEVYFASGFIDTSQPNRVIVSDARFVSVADGSWWAAPLMVLHAKVGRNMLHGKTFVIERPHGRGTLALDGEIVGFMTHVDPVEPPKFDEPDCKCLVDPMSSTCGEWDQNTSACSCVEMGLQGTLPA